MTLVTPIKAVYFSALIKYIIANPMKKETKTEEKYLSSLYLTTSTTVIGIHMISLILIVVFFALFRFIEFKSMMLMISSIETFFGVYVGLFLTNLFEVKKNLI